MPRPVLYWSYEITTRDAHHDAQRYTDFGFNTQADAEFDALMRIADCADLGHTDASYTASAVYGAE
jgi:hypothetical protein